MGVGVSVCVVYSLSLSRTPNKKKEEEESNDGKGEEPQHTWNNDYGTDNTRVDCASFNVSGVSAPPVSRTASICSKTAIVLFWSS